MSSDKVSEKSCVEICEKDIEYFYNLKLPIGEEEYEKTNGTDLDDIADEKFDLVKWMKDKEEEKLNFREAHI